MTPTLKALISLNLKYIARTDKAMLFEDANKVQAWLPRSQIEVDESECIPYEQVDVNVREWLAIKVGFIWQ